MLNIALRSQVTFAFIIERTMGKGGENAQELNGRKISMEELSHHRTPDDGK